MAREQALFGGNARVKRPREQKKRNFVQILVKLLRLEMAFY